MTSITIELSDELAAALTAKADAWRMTVAELVRDATESFLAQDQAEGWDPSLTREDIAAIEEGLADATAGRTVSHEAVMEEARKLLRR
jgi:predicted transcriptional regulator